MWRRVDNPPNPWASTAVEWLGEPPPARLEVYEERARSILAHNDSPDLGFSWSLNPYRGCFHGCAYCYARPSHEKLGLGAGTDFERRLVVKVNAPELLEQALARPGWRGELIVFSGVTDCYQPLEACYGLTRRCLEVCCRYRNPVGIVTKGALIERDLDVLAELARTAYAAVHVSLPILQAARARALEPNAPSPRRRLQTVARLAAAGVPVGVLVAPLIPGLNDEEIPAVLRAAREAGARWARHVMLRLPGSVLPVFLARLAEALPARAGRVIGAIRACRQGRLNDPRFGARFRGSGPRWQAVQGLFELVARRLGFGEPPPVPVPSPFRRPGHAHQRLLFGGGGADRAERGPGEPG